jgi:uncharacterized protein YndB with AHSA1/START domain
VSVVSVDKDYDTHRLVLVAEFAAPIEQVWLLWADPRKLERWWGPPSHPATFERHDLAAGGDAAYFMTGPDGERSRGWWRITSVDAPRSLAFIDGFARPDGSPNDELPATSVEVGLAEHDGGTRMELRFLFASTDHMDMLERWGAFDVFPLSVAQMDALIAAR